MLSTRGPRRPLVVVLALIVVLAAAARRVVDVVEVRGRSMRPTLEPGDRLVVVRFRRAGRAGDIVLAIDPREPARELVKRVAAIRPDGLDLRGDDPGWSTDARTFGHVPARAVRWRVVWRYWPPERFGAVR